VRSGGPAALAAPPRVRPGPPGFGRSGTDEEILEPAEHADVLDAWMDITGIGPAVVIGTSVGAQVAAELARRHPERCTAVVLASPTVDAGRRRWMSQLVRWQREQSMQSFRLRRLIVADYMRCGAGRVIRTFRSAMHHRIEEAVEEIAPPVLVCWGTRDPLLSRSWVEELAGRASDGQLGVLPGAEHALSHESPLELARATEYFLDQLAARAGAPPVGSVHGHGELDHLVVGQVEVQLDEQSDRFEVRLVEVELVELERPDPNGGRP
jgi:2-hydroxy-6-oxonona-2,4-dienedioate hydrolase